MVLLLPPERKKLSIYDTVMLNPHDATLHHETGNIVDLGGSLTLPIETLSPVSWCTVASFGLTFNLSVCLLAILQKTTY